MEEITSDLVQITGGFWGQRLKTNAESAIYHQWKQLEDSGCINNFRIATREKVGFREGWFFSDSDSYKWLEAASRIWRSHLHPGLSTIMESFISLLGRVQEPDGYIFTYNQIHFPGTRWVNLQIEHELYCHGHLIEAGISHHSATGQGTLLEIAQRAADLLVKEFMGKGTKYTPGHEEIEIALLRLHRYTSNTTYFDLARQFIEQRGRDPFFSISILRQNANVASRKKTVDQQRENYLKNHPDHSLTKIPPENFSKKYWNSTLRWYMSALSGKYFQQHVPVRKQTTPVGHSVRFGYLEAAIAMLCRLEPDESLLRAMQSSWEHMLTSRMYVTGGIGSLPVSEGFGNDYELDPEYGYAETCAALASIFWSWEMALIFGESKFSDLIEWQLYNAAGVGMGWDGTSYFYNNPLVSQGSLERRSWFSIPCCPSNLSRTWANLGKYVYSWKSNEVWVHQYYNNQLVRSVKNSNSQINDAFPIQLRMESDLPWGGKVKIQIHVAPKTEIILHFRKPSWSENAQIWINDEVFSSDMNHSIDTDHSMNGKGKTKRDSGLPVSLSRKDSTASDFDPRDSSWITLRRIWTSGDVIEIEFFMPIRLHQVHPKVRGLHNKIAISRGPLVYCLESLDNPGVDIFNTCLEPASLNPYPDENFFDGSYKIKGRTTQDESLTFIPYMLWGNRGASKMCVYVNISEG